MTKKTSNPIFDIPAYLKVFQTYIGWRMYLVFVLTLLAVLLEGFGIVMLLPLLQSLGTGGPVAEASSGGGLGAGTPEVLTRFLETLGLTSVTAILTIIGITFLLKGLITFAANGYAGYLQAQLMRELKARLFDAYSCMDYLYYARRDTGHFVNIINKQTYDFYTSFRFLIRLLAGVITTLSYFSLALMIAWRFGLMTLGTGVVLLLFFKRLNNYIRDLSRKSSREESHLAKLLIQSLQSFKYLTATAQIGPLRGGVMASIRRLTGYQARWEIANAFTLSIREPLTVLFIVLIVIVQITMLHQPLTPIMVSILLFHRGLNGVLIIQGAWQEVLTLIGAVELVRDEFADQARHREPDGSHELGPFSKGIEFRDINFAYDANIGNVLHWVSLAMPARTSVALVGESGAGKSTLIDMLSLLLKPQSGQVLIDGVPGDEIRLATWRRQIGYVSQDTVVFDDTLANNICLWEGEIAADPELFERVRDAAHRAHIDQFIESLPEGYHTKVGDRGIRLSGGQRQRLFIARELFKRPTLLILDEATSALDSESERHIQQSIDALRGQMTVVIVAHRLSTIRNVDWVFVFDHGRLVEQGPYADLRDRYNSKFGAMAALQSL